MGDTRELELVRRKMFLVCTDAFKGKFTLSATNLND